MRNRIHVALPLMAVFWAATSVATYAASTGVQIQANVPLVCEASILSSNVVTFTPLVINAQVQQSCNSTHELKVTYAPANLTRPNLLFMFLAGQPPVAKTPGDVDFGNFQSTNLVKRLRILYAGGTLGERQQLAQTIAIAVTPL
ncbi:MAG: hypothetical protein K8S25_05660 [Alphaproteobacteria bacterium]|nr:hypothetical protein [Alphaproteobacteria bacterium]